MNKKITIDIKRKYIKEGRYDMLCRMMEDLLHMATGKPYKIDYSENSKDNNKVEFIVEN